MNCLDRFKKQQKADKSAFENGRDEGVRQAVQFILFSVIQYLGDKRGWKPERIMEGVSWIHKHAMMIDEGYTTFDEVMEAVEEEYGIKYENGVFSLEVKNVS